MINENNIKSIDSIDKDSYSDSASKDQTSLNEKIGKDISSVSTIKPWFKKKSIIIAMSSTLGAAILTTAVAVPLSLTSASPTIISELSKVKAIYDLTNKTTKLIVSGLNLPNDFYAYLVYKVTNARASFNITANVKFNAVSSSEVHFDFIDKNIIKNQVYQVKLSNASSANNDVVSGPIENLVPPTLTVTNNPTDQTIENSAVDQFVNFSVEISTITNPVPDASPPAYQWEISDSQTGTFTPIDDVEARKATFRYNTSNIPVNIKKFLRCKITYQYMIPVYSTSASVIKIAKPVITIGTHPTDHNLDFSAQTATLSVAATVTHGVTGQSLSYQWLSAATIDGVYANVSGATLASYTLSSSELSAITPGTKKFFKCKVSYANAISVDSNPSYINRALQPVINISAFSPNAELANDATQTTLSVTATVTNGVQNQITYQWESSDNNVVWTRVDAATSSTYNFTGVQNIVAGGKKYFRCQVSYPNLTPTLSTVVYVSRELSQTGINITSQPATILLDHSQTTATLSVTAQIVSGATLTYQWQEADAENGSYTNVVNNGNSNTYTLASVGYGFSKYYKCIVSSAGVESKTSNIAHISRLLQPVITIDTQPTASVALPAEQSTTTLSVVASVANGVTNQALNYQWKTSTTETGNYTNVASNGTSADYVLTDVASESSNYYKCEITSANAEMKTSNVSHVTRAKVVPVIIIDTQPTATIALTASETTATLSVVARVTNGTVDQALTYQWKTSATRDGVYENVAGAGTSANYVLSNVTPGSSNFYKCEISSANAVMKISEISHVTRIQGKPVMSFVEKPSNQTLPANAETVTPFVINATVTNGETSGITYQWKKYSYVYYSNIDGATSSTYTPPISLLYPGAGDKTWFKCVLSYPGASSIEVEFWVKRTTAQAKINITKEPIAQTLTSASTNFSLNVEANVSNPLASGQPITYQWQSSTSESGPYTNIASATNVTYTETLNANKNAWRDTWYRCQLSYVGASNPILNTTPALVKMTLTAEEAKAELVKWLAVEANAKNILTEFFNSALPENEGKKLFYSSLHDNEFREGFPTVVVDSITPQDITTATAAYPIPYKSYTIRLKTTSDVNISAKSSGGGTTTPASVHPAGMIIEFNTLFSFGDTSVEFVKADETKYNMLLTPTFGVNSTSIEWTSTGGATTVPYKKGNYPVKFYANATDTSPVITDSVYLPSRLQGINNTNYTFIPTYNII